ncbi:MAG: adenylate/guanylate cyclase domain-containing protein [Cyanothece sp. SIO2G6]|nr:adenylate/guanylate cyclase domain-containing protein [Cyanothece sp. SIO2G6]
MRLFRQFLQRYQRPSMLSFPPRSADSNRSPRHRGTVLPLWSYTILGLWGLLGAIATAIELPLSQTLERQAQVIFFQIRGPVPPPSDIVILEIDQGSLSQGEFYQSDPARYPEFEVIQAWPWQRSAYAIAIERLLASGARAVALDLILADPSFYGEADDQQLQQVLQVFSGQIVLAAAYESFGETGVVQAQIVYPNPIFATEDYHVGLINVLPDLDGRIYQLPTNFDDLVLKPEGFIQDELMSFPEAVISASGEQIDPAIQGDIYYYGPANTFPHIPFWHVLDSENWSLHQQQQTFKNKIVLIGPTAAAFQDIVRTPFTHTMSGIEVHANATATLLNDQAIRPLFPHATLQGGIILATTLGITVLLHRFQKQPLKLLLIALTLQVLWGTSAYLVFTYLRYTLPTVIPIMAIALSGFSGVTYSSIVNTLEQRRLRMTLERYVAAPIVREILTQRSDDFQNLLRGQKVKAAVLFCDIRNFTTLSLDLEPEILVEQLNSYLNAMVNAILDEGGTVDKFIGDAIMAEFGSPVSQGPRADALNAVRAALGMRRALANLQADWQQDGKVVFFNGMGINYGEAIAGDIGSVRRREYALIGDAVNVASRIEGLTRSLKTDILITESLYQLITDAVDVIDMGEHLLKGRSQVPVRVYSLIGMKDDDPTLYKQIHAHFQ